MHPAVASREVSNGAPGNAQVDRDIGQGGIRMFVSVARVGQCFRGKYNPASFKRVCGS
jgi:hypothetical protein